jgi:uncharacterized protein (TIGR00106 family)
MIVASVSIIPVGKGESAGAIVAEAVDEADKSGLDYRLTAMGTVVEGEWDAVMKLVKKMRDRVMKKAPRAWITVTIDDRNGKRSRLEAKVKSVERRLAKSLRK